MFLQASVCSQGVWYRWECDIERVCGVEGGVCLVEGGAVSGPPYEMSTAAVGTHPTECILFAQYFEN